ncbi:MAG: hypothetical protein CM1200mP16_12050 [Nitrospina sp.]|nr:MAG: hypothetical protein CM1200mP16_12050 [Nitrospina sp.]
MQDQVIGKATRREIHQKQLIHRSIHILVFNYSKQIFLKKRSNTKDENPGEILGDIFIRRPCGCG